MMRCVGGSPCGNAVSAEEAVTAIGLIIQWYGGGVKTKSVVVIAQRTGRRTGRCRTAARRMLQWWMGGHISSRWGVSNRMGGIVTAAA